MAESTTVNKLAKDRLQIGIEASCEIDALIGLMRENFSRLDVDSDQTDWVQVSLQIRSLTTRMQQLNSVVMSVFADDDTTKNLAHRVFGNDSQVLKALEVAHG